MRLPLKRVGLSTFFLGLQAKYSGYRAIQTIPMVANINATPVNDVPPAPGSFGLHSQ
jgi:hypothetical protein